MAHFKHIYIALRMLYPAYSDLYNNFSSYQISLILNIKPPHVKSTQEMTSYADNAPTQQFSNLSYWSYTIYYKAHSLN